MMGNICSKFNKTGFINDEVMLRTQLERTDGCDSHILVGGGYKKQCIMGLHGFFTKICEDSLAWSFCEKAAGHLIENVKF